MYYNEHRPIDVLIYTLKSNSAFKKNKQFEQLGIS